MRTRDISLSFATSSSAMQNFILSLLPPFTASHSSTMLGLRALQHSFRAVKAWTRETFDYRTPMGRNMIPVSWPVILFTPPTLVMQMYIYLERRQVPTVEAFEEEQGE
ncbi:hypothetical protein DL98DRAFT_511354 [Cadophora sp. DSE1049]|nr:hypothetical protein DL98DRAFT_511354 [Cadophora sp. DSE1049]